MKFAYLYYINEIRYRICYYFYSLSLIFLISYIFADHWIYFFSKPFLVLCLPNLTLSKNKVRENEQIPLFADDDELIDNFFEKRIILNNMTEGFSSIVQISLLIGFLFSIPSLIYNFWSFAVGGLSYKERIYLNKWLLISFILLGSSLGFFYLVILPYFWSFFLQFEVHSLVLNLKIEPKISSYLSLTFFLLFIFLSLNFCINFFLLALSSRWVSGSQLKFPRKLVFFVSLIISSLICPPDPLSQLIVNLLIFGIYEIFLFIGLVLDVS